jgi:hypothetical protein
VLIIFFPFSLFSSFTWASANLRFPLSRGLLFSEALIIVTLGGKQLLEVRLAIHHPLHGCIISEGNDHTTVAALEAGLVEHLLALLLFNDGLLSGIDSLVAYMALLSVQGSLTEPGG